ncbi:MAG: SMP-30/gluconolactonase/LRE family protein [Dehalococcoidia bacterium]|nr:SMP-30/gluconolactonase/LRE family protein [Dehalococcoidia bacterium]
MQPELIADYHCVTGEGPLWHPKESCLYWADIPEGRLFRYNPFTRVHEQIYDGRVVGGYTIQADGSLLLFMDRCSVAVLRDGELDFIVDELPDEADNRFNDVIADPAGRVFCGTMPSPSGRPATLYRMDTDGSITPVLEDLGLCNGMGFTSDLKSMYFTDSLAHEIYIFDYHIESGEIGNQRTFVQTPDDDGTVPDGMTVDAEDHVWSARWDGSALYRFAPDGTEVARIDFPAKKVSSVIFGGRDLTDMYVTTAGGNDKPNEGPGAGALFRLNLGIKGKPEYLSRIYP